MSWYKDDKDAWKAIIETVVSEEHRSVQMVEKDTIQSMFLLGLSKKDQANVGIHISNNTDPFTGF